jgi:uncharacterized protein (DUF1330 family)
MKEAGVKEAGVKGYLFAEVEVTDPETYKQYMPLAGAAIAAYGGRFVIRGGDPEVVEGGRRAKRCVFVEFESVERLKEFYHSAQYQAAAAIRQRASTGHVYLLSGTPE